MRRLSDEWGRSASARNFGRLALFAIPLALGLAASVWLGVYIGAHQFRHSLTQEERAAVYVGAESLPRSPLKIDAKSAQKFCAAITKADLDGKVLRLYAKNDCTVELTGMEWHYELIAPDGTILHDGYLNQRDCSVPRMIGDSAECVFAGTYGGYIHDDSRAAQIRVWTVPFRK